MIIDILLLVAGLFLLFVGGEGLVRGSVSLAERLGLSTLLVSLVIVGFGTSTPELLVSIKAALQGSSDIALGNVVGSNICNVLLILGLAAIINRVSCDRAAVRRDAMAVVAGSILITSFSFFTNLNVVHGVVMVGALVAYLFYCYLQDSRAIKKEKAALEALRDHLHEDKSTPHESTSLLLNLGYGFGGLILLILGADLLVNGATSIARQANISEAVIGLSIVAVGTSLPELATAIVAAYRRHGDVVIGNILGSNLFNILGILGITAIITPVPFTSIVADRDVWVMLSVAVILYGLIFWNKNLDRNAGTMFLCAYLIYVAVLFNTL